MRPRGGTGGGGSPKCIFLGESSQSEKTAYCLILILWHSGKGKTVGTPEGSVVPGGGGGDVGNGWRILGQ